MAYACRICGFVLRQCRYGTRTCPGYECPNLDCPAGCTVVEARRPVGLPDEQCRASLGCLAPSWHQGECRFIVTRRVVG